VEFDEPLASTIVLRQSRRGSRQCDGRHGGARM